MSKVNNFFPEHYQPRVKLTDQPHATAISRLQNTEREKNSKILAEEGSKHSAENSPNHLSENSPKHLTKNSPKKLVAESSKFVFVQAPAVLPKLSFQPSRRNFY